MTDSAGTSEQLRETALTGIHRALGARLIEFGGWLMPVQYSSILEEHRAVRERAGLFDLSHMGELFVEGDDAGDALAAALVTDPRTLAVGRAHYSMICAPDGGIIDDLIVYRLGSERFLVVANASNATTVSDELARRLERWRAVLDDRSLVTSLVAIQGPRSAGILGPLTTVDLGSLRYYAIAEGEVAGIPAHVARTGYTGEDGFEVFVDWARGPEVWLALQDAGRDAGTLPCGLGARDTLRLEAGMPLYGNELDRATNPFEAGLGRVVKLEKPGDFVGRAALERVVRDGIAKRLVGLRVTGRGIARHGYPVDDADGQTGVVTSGTQSPTLGYPIAMAYVAPGDGEPGTMLDVEVRDQRIPAEVVPLPFYKRADPRADAGGPSPRSSESSAASQTPRSE
ncbi:MAG TPA: glycine cleavage system aminomethyltransferase GcvT [Candidatus Limnocylindrales bacterium]|nr:glycine cleavage system aminomethyltransferase GcvT [Candidatus Limnocylindrales bacterium]